MILRSPVGHLKLVGQVAEGPGNLADIEALEPPPQKGEGTQPFVRIDEPFGIVTERTQVLQRPLAAGADPGLGG